MKPFLKWAGNKYQIIERVLTALPAGKRLIEPFVGSGAVFLNTDYSRYLLTDVNSHLINLYQHLQAEGEQLIEDCRTFFISKNNQSKKFYALRDLFNTTEDLRLKALLFVYLNKHCFNGLCRYNAKGKFNTPFGRYKNPYFPEKEMQFFYQKSKKRYSKLPILKKRYPVSVRAMWCIVIHRMCLYLKRPISPVTAAGALALNNNYVWPKWQSNWQHVVLQLLFPIMTQN